MRGIQIPGRFRRRDQNPCAAVLDHVADPIRRIGRVDRHIGAAGHQGAELCDDQIDRARQRNRHEPIGADTGLAKGVRQAVRSRDQVPVAQALTGESQRLVVRELRSTTRDLRVQRQRGDRAGGVVYLGEQTLVFLRQCRRRRERLSRLALTPSRNSVLQNGLVLLGQGLDETFIEQITDIVPIEVPIVSNGVKHQVDPGAGCAGPNPRSHFMIQRFQGQVRGPHEVHGITEDDGTHRAANPFAFGDAS